MLVAPLRRRLGVALLISLSGVPLTAIASDADPYPQRPVRIVVPFGAGGTTDIAARALASKLQARLGQPVIVENRAGAVTAIGSEFVAKAARDGLTLLYSGSTTFSVLPALRQDLPLNPDTTWSPIGMVAQTAVVVSTRAAGKIHSFADIARQANAGGAGVTYGTFGPGSAPHLVGAMIARSIKAAMTAVPYKGSAQVLTDVIGGQIDLSIDPVAVVQGNINAGKLRPLAISSATRSPLLPNVPTFAEVGVASGGASFWYGLVAPKGTPAPIVDRLQAELRAIVQDAEYREVLAKQGLETLSGGAEEFRRRTRAEITQFRQLARDANIRME